MEVVCVKNPFYELWVEDTDEIIKMNEKLYDFISQHRSLFPFIMPHTSDIKSLEDIKTYEYKSLGWLICGVNAKYESNILYLNWIHPSHLVGYVSDLKGISRDKIIYAKDLDDFIKIIKNKSI